MVIVPLRLDVLVFLLAVIVTVVEPFVPVEGDTVIQSGVLMVSHAKLAVMVTLHEPSCAEKLRDVSLTVIDGISTGSGVGVGTILLSEGIFSGLQASKNPDKTVDIILILFI